MNYIPVTLSNGMDVKVYAVPPYVINTVLAKFEEPPVPKRPVNPEVDIPGANQTVDNPEDPEYIASLQKFRTDRAEAYMTARLLYGLRDERVPERWPTEEDKERWDYLQISPVIPEKGEGRRLAWIKFGVLASSNDMEVVLTVMDSFNKVDKAEVDALIDSFRNKGSRDSTK